MTRMAPDIVIEGHMLGDDTPLRVELRRARSRWTVLVFEAAVDDRRLYEIASVRSRFTAEDATLLVVSDVPAQWSEQRVHAVYDRDNAIRDAFGARGRAAVVIAPDGVIHHAAIGRCAEQGALRFVAAMRTGTPVLARAA
jgi:hypothetical protein